MAMFVHIALAKHEAAIRRSGIRARNALFGGKAFGPGVFAFPVVASHTLTHQWTREILKWRRQPLIGVYFRIPDDEIVGLRKMGGRSRNVTAAEAVAVVRAHEDPRGFEVITARIVEPNEIVRIKALRGLMGWRHFPDAHGKRPCACEDCLRGEPGGRRILERATRGEF